MSISNQTLEQVVDAFAAWRNNKSSGGRIPEALWSQVIALLSSHKKSHVLRALGISGSQLNKRLLNLKSAKLVTYKFPDIQASLLWTGPNKMP